MFTFNDMWDLLRAQPFVPFRMHLTDGGNMDIRHPEIVMPGRRYAIVAVVDPAKPDAPFDKHSVVWYLHVSRVEHLDLGAPPFSAPPPSIASSPTPV